MTSFTFGLYDGSIFITIMKVDASGSLHEEVVNIDPVTGEKRSVYQDRKEAGHLNPSIHSVSSDGGWLALTLAFADPKNPLETRPRVGLIRADGSMNSPEFISPLASREYIGHFHPNFPVFSGEVIYHTKEAGRYSKSVQKRDMDGNLLAERDYGDYGIDYDTIVYLNKF